MPEMIQEVIVTTTNSDGSVHIAPMGIHEAEGERLIIALFKPSRTLDNLRRTRQAVVNHCDDVRVFAGCVTGRREWPVLALDNGLDDDFGEDGQRNWRLEAALSHQLVEMVEYQADAVRPRCLCEIRGRATHAPFRGFNRAQAAVLEATILVSRLERLPAEKVQHELEYLCVAMDKTAGARERQAWQWLMTAVEDWQTQRASAQSS